ASCLSFIPSAIAQENQREESGLLTLCPKCDNWFFDNHDVSAKLCPRCSLLEEVKHLIQDQYLRPENLDSETLETWNELRILAADLDDTSVSLPWPLIDKALDKQAN
ncbi:MAG: hypothetical protein JW867_08040, partial [Candidatus Omnitrophica bacterium]|nr:hypothetical protein [Candidatus Omnitrophota bacterium]